MGVKGSWERPRTVSDTERALRYELIFCKDKERKKAIKAELARLHDYSHPIWGKE